MGISVTIYNACITHMLFLTNQDDPGGRNFNTSGRSQLEWVETQLLRFFAAVLEDATEEIGLPPYCQSSIQFL